MPGWKDLYRAIRNERDAANIVDSLNLPPSRVARLLRSQRLRERFELDRQVAGAKSSLSAATQAASADYTLSCLMNCAPPETARKASMDLVRLVARDAHQMKSAKPAPPLQATAKPTLQEADEQ